MPEFTYNHAFDIAFEVPGSTSETGEEVTAAELRAAIKKRIDVSDEDLLEFIGAPYDTYTEMRSKTEFAHH